ncbi:MAG: serine/threonine protein kinase [Candidatus Eremiobacteraeota bacterium]|nr:serine/threonine protein kinase [Candidatus Eremiobacteraeota bacterium]
MAPLAWGEPGKILHTVKFRTQPRSGVEVVVDSASYPASETVALDFSFVDSKIVEFRRQGFVSEQRTVSAQEASAGVYPPLSLAPISLHASSPLTGLVVWMQENPFQGLLGLALLGLALPAVIYRGVATWRRQQVLQERLSRLDAGRDRGDSVLMSRIEGYLLVELLGHGGMAAVYRAVPADSMDESQAVAVKLLSRHLFREPDFIRRFQREVSAYQKLAHPNIVRVVSWREMDASGDPPYIILELVPGRTLPQEGMSWPEARPLLEQIFSAVAFAHRHGVVHRDLKPDNIMVHQGRVKVMDFGLARNHDASQLTASGTVLGTPAYMAPEQLSQGSSAPAVDQYALGAVAYRLLSGRLPHEADDVMALFARVLSADPVPLDHYQPDLPPQVVAVVMRMLAHNQEHRFESVEEAWKAFPA